MLYCMLLLTNFFAAKTKWYARFLLGTLYLNFKGMFPETLENCLPMLQATQQIHPNYSHGHKLIITKHSIVLSNIINILYCTIYEVFTILHGPANQTLFLGSDTDVSTSSKKNFQLLENKQLIVMINPPIIRVCLRPTSTWHKLLALIYLQVHKKNSNFQLE